MSSKLIAIRSANRYEKKHKHADVVFERHDGKRKHRIFACVCYESWEQWGASLEILHENMAAVERWRNGQSEIECEPELL